MPNPKFIKEMPLPEFLTMGIRWSFRLSTSIFRKLPDFIIIGTQRGGTTSLYNYLAGHPQVQPSFLKETHFFDYHYQKGLYWYRSYFPFNMRGRSSPDKPDRIVLTGEATPYYLYHPHVPSRVFRALPDVKLIVLIRNPIDRAFSHYQHLIRNGIEKLSFEEAIKRESALLSGEINKILIDKHYRSFFHQNFSYLNRGLYIDQLLNWSKYFRKDQFLILKSENLFEKPTNTLIKVLDFLGILEWEPPNYEKFNQSIYNHLNSSTFQMLSDYFRPYNQRLYDYISEDYGW